MPDDFLLRRAFPLFQLGVGMLDSMPVERLDERAQNLAAVLAQSCLRCRKPPVAWNPSEYQILTSRGLAGRRAAQGFCRANVFILLLVDQESISAAKLAPLVAPRRLLSGCARHRYPWRRNRFQNACPTICNSADWYELRSCARPREPVSRFDQRSRCPCQLRSPKLKIASRCQLG